MGVIIVEPLRGTLVNRFLARARNDRIVLISFQHSQRDFVIPSEVEGSIETASAEADSIQIPFSGKPKQVIQMDDKLI